MTTHLPLQTEAGQMARARTVMAQTAIHQPMPNETPAENTPTENMINDENTRLNGNMNCTPLKAGVPFHIKCVVLYKVFARTSTNKMKSHQTRMNGQMGTNGQTETAKQIPPLKQQPAKHDPRKTLHQMRPPHMVKTKPNGDTKQPSTENPHEPHLPKQVWMKTWERSLATITIPVGAVDWSRISCTTLSTILDMQESPTRHPTAGGKSEMGMRALMNDGVELEPVAELEDVRFLGDLDCLIDFILSVMRISSGAPSWDNICRPLPLQEHHAVWTQVQHEMEFDATAISDLQPPLTTQRNERSSADYDSDASSDDTEGGELEEFFEPQEASLIVAMDQASVEEA
ncbi:hypothetical protein BS47DRAFT_1364931 [Hydnum rufescens UP504]|uniref:Uncharacterized protein n=1 Tax=Hydnum rufescens UP504 TaxID=1448309 RepID=A0A9P6AS92_9AGAM|nr:hypothetical protein BS47DRAFT_1364931 [Hydnum rufescens UP504]